MIEPIQVACPLCKALPGESCRTLGLGTSRPFHANRYEEAGRRRPDPRQLPLLPPDPKVVIEGELRRVAGVLGQPEAEFTIQRSRSGA